MHSTMLTTKKKFMLLVTLSSISFLCVCCLLSNTRSLDEKSIIAHSSANLIWTLSQSRGSKKQVSQQSALTDCALFYMTK